MRISFKYILAVCALFFSGSAFADVNVALWSPLAGDKVSAGRDVLAGAQVAVEELNANGGLLGEKINLIPIEDQCNDSLNLSTAQMFALNQNTGYKPNVVIGPYCFNQFQHISETLTSAKIFQIIPTPLNLSYQPNTSGLVTLVGSQAHQAKAFFDYYNKTFNWLHVALIFNRQNESLARNIQTLFQQNGKGDNLLSYSFEAMNFDYDEIAEQALDSHTHVALILGDTESVGQMAKNLKSRKRKYLIFVDRYQALPDFEYIMGSLMENCYFIDLPSLKDNPDLAETLVKLRLLNVKPEGFSVYSYSAVQFWAALVKKARSFQYDKLLQTLKTQRIDFGWGPSAFINGTPKTLLNYTIYQYLEGEYTQVY